MATHVILHQKRVVLQIAMNGINEIRWHKLQTILHYYIQFLQYQL